MGVGDDKREPNIVVHAYDWVVHDESTDEGHVAIHAWCLDRQSKPCLLRIEDFDPWCYIELPLFVGREHMRWTQSQLERVEQWLRNKLGEDHEPTNIRYVQPKKLYYYRGDRVYPMLKVSFKSLRDLERCKTILSSPPKISGLVGAQDVHVAFRVHEDTNIPLVRKLLTEQKCRFSQWFSVMEYARPEDKLTNLPNEYIIRARDIQPIGNDVSRGWCTFPRLLSFDIECYSNNHKAMPHKNSAKHVVFAISCVFQQLGKPETRRKWVLVLGNCHDIPGAEIIRLNSEVELINKLSDMVVELDPEIITGYNILGFDYPYLNARLGRRLKEWKPMGRIIGRRPTLKEKTWESSAYGHNTICYLQMDGRLSIDVLPIIRRDYKLDKYDLGSVSAHFLNGRTKHPIKAQQMFQAYEEFQTADVAYKFMLSLQVDAVRQLFQAAVEKYKSSWYQLDTLVAAQLRLEGSELLLQAARHPELQADHDPILIIEHYLKCLRDITDVMRYCERDSDLVVDLFEKLNIWISLVEMSNIVGVTPMELFTSGQQVRCLSLLYNLAHEQGFVIDSRTVAPISFNGGFVFDPVPGLYDNIICLDFASLYPSIIQAYNICYTTLLAPEMKDFPDEKCNVFDFDQEEETADETDVLADPAGKPKPASKKMTHHHYRWVKAEVRPGLLPKLVADLVAERKAVRKILAGIIDDRGNYLVPKTPEIVILATILDKRQNALKVTANSFFGFLGAQTKGRLPLIEGAMCITAKGRQLITEVNNYVTQRYGAKMVYGDTDSAMIDLHITNPKDCHTWGHRLSDEIGGTKDRPGLFPPPLRMEFEKAMRLYCRGKKNYAYCLIAPDGSIKTDRKSIKKKGMGSARRDKCKWMSKTLDALLENIMNRQPFESSIDLVVDAVASLLKGQVKLEDLSFIRGLGANYKQANYFMKVFAEGLANIGKPCSPGDRLEFVIVTPSPERTPPVNKLLLGHKMRLMELYKEERDEGRAEPIDVMYYIEKALMNAIDDQFASAYKDEVVRLANIGYKSPYTRHHQVSITSPVKLMVRMIYDRQDVETIKPWVRQQLQAMAAPPPIRLVIIPAMLT